MVSPDGFEPPTPSVSEKRSPGLSYGDMNLLATGKETRRQVPFEDVWIVFLLFLGAGIWIGIQIGGHRAARNIRDFEHAERLRRAGLRKRVLW